MSDTGRGIAAEFLPRVFERFGQETPRRGPGAGLSLAIVKSLAKLHSGPARVKSGGEGNRQLY